MACCLAGRMRCHAVVTALHERYLPLISTYGACLSRPLAELLKRFVDEAGREKVSCVVTDNASNMRAARDILVSMDGYGHIIVLR